MSSLISQWHKRAILPCSGGERSRGYAGFTLLELLVVVALIAIVGALAMPKMQVFLQGDGLQTSARQSIGFVQQTAQLARQGRQAYVLRYEAGQHALVAQAVDAAAMRSRQKRGQAQPGQGSGRQRRLLLPETVQLAAIHVKQRQGAENRSRRSHFYISDKGYAEPASIVLATQDGEKQLSLIASPFLGRIKVVEGYADPASAELFR